MAKTHPNAKKLVLETVVTVLPSFLSMPTALIAIPVLFSQMGGQNFGLILVVTLLINHSHILMAGMERSVSLRLAKGSKGEEFNALFSLCLVALGLSMGTFALFSGFGLVAEFYDEKGDVVFFWYAFVGIPIQFAWATQRAYLIGLEKFNSLGIFNFLQLSAHFLVPTLIVLALDPVAPLPTLLGAIIGFRILVLLGVSCWLVPVKFRSPLSTVLTMKSLFGYGRWLGAGQALVVLQETCDRFIISIILSPAQAVLYMVPLQLSQKLVMVPQAFATVIFPKIARSQNVDFSKLYIFQFLLIGGTLGFFLINEMGLKLWLSESYHSEMLFVSAVTFVALCYSAQNFVVASAIEALGKAKLLSKIDAGIFCVYLILMVGAILNFGIYGAAVALLCKEMVVFFMRFHFFPALQGNVVVNNIYTFITLMMLFLEIAP